MSKVLKFHFSETAWAQMTAAQRREASALVRQMFASMHAKYGKRTPIMECTVSALTPSSPGEEK
jgi:hypothetical protein